MNGNKTKFYRYRKKGSGQITIPVAIANDLGLENKNSLNIVIKTIDGKKGLFLYKGDEENEGKSGED